MEFALHNLITFFSPIKRRLGSYKRAKYEFVTAMLIWVSVSWVRNIAGLYMATSI
jgi:hypothetical protein